MAEPAGPVPDRRCAAGRLSGPTRQVHLAVLAAFIATGQPPPAELDRLARVHRGEPGAVLAELVGADVFVFTADDEIRAVVEDHRIHGIGAEPWPGVQNLPPWMRRLRWDWPSSP
jgi:hypothetical protein